MLLPLLGATLFLTAVRLYADPVTIVDEPDTPPPASNDQFTSGYIDNYLVIAGSLASTLVPRRGWRWKRAPL